LAIISPRATNPELPIAKSIRAAEAAVPHERSHHADPDDNTMWRQVV
jgi:hypothetical protein